MKRVVTSVLLVLLLSLALLNTEFAFFSRVRAELDDLKAGIDLTTYSTDFDWKTLFRRPKNHIGEKYMISGRLVSIGTLKNGGYDEAWIELNEYTKNDEYILLWIDPLEFNLLDNDWLDVYLTITGVGPLSKYSKDHEVFYASVEALTVYDGKGGEVLETYVKTGGDIPEKASGNKYPDIYSSKFDYEEIYRNPEKYEGNKYYLEGKVVQVLGDKEKGFNLRVAYNGNSDQIVFVVGSSDLNFLENDSVAIYGTFMGNYTYSSFATQITIPRIDGDVELVK